MGKSKEINTERVNESNEKDYKYQKGRKSKKQDKRKSWNRIAKNFEQDGEIVFQSKNGPKK